MNTSVNTKLAESLEAIKDKLVIHTHNSSEVDLVVVDLGDNILMINHEHPYLVNQNPIDLPPPLNDLFRIEKKDGHFNVKLKTTTLEDIMDAFQIISDKKSLD